MTFYIVSILSAVLLIITGNLIFNVYELSVLYIILATVIGTIAVIAVGGLFAFIIRRMPEKWFSYKKRIFQVPECERKYYKFIRVKKWKDKVLELGQFTNFSKKEVKEKNNNEYIERFILECNYGFIIHIVDMIMGFLIIFMFKFEYIFMFPIPIACVSMVLHYLPMCVLRYNVPKLIMLHERNVREQERKLKNKELEESNLVEQIEENSN